MFVKSKMVANQSAAWPKGYRRRFYYNPESIIIGSSLTLITLLRPRRRRFTMKSKSTENLKSGQPLSGCGFVQTIVPPSLSRYRRIIMYLKEKEPAFGYELLKCVEVNTVPGASYFISLICFETATYRT